MQYVLVVKHIEGITNVTLCAICTGCETHRGNNKRLPYVQYVVVVKHIEGITNITLCAICTGCETHRGDNTTSTYCT